MQVLGRGLRLQASAGKAKLFESVFCQHFRPEGSARSSAMSSKFVITRSKTRSRVPPPPTSSHGGVAVQVLVEDYPRRNSECVMTTYSYFGKQWQDHLRCVVSSSSIWCNVHDTVEDAVNSIGLNHTMGAPNGPPRPKDEDVTRVERLTKPHPSDIIVGTAYATIAKMKLSDERGQTVYVNVVHPDDSTSPVELKRDTKLWEAQKLIAEKHLPVKREWAREWVRKLDEALNLDKSEFELFDHMIFHSAYPIDVNQLWLRVLDVDQLC